MNERTCELCWNGAEKVQLKINEKPESIEIERCDWCTCSANKQLFYRQRCAMHIEKCLRSIETNQSISKCDTR